MSVADYEIVDAHVHLCRDPAQERVVFPRPGWPKHWYWCSPERVIPYMDQVNCTHVFVPNVMATHRMTRSRLARLPQDTPEAEVEAVRARLKAEMQDKVRKFNDWIVDVHKTEPRIVPFVLIDPVLFGDGSIDEFERCLARGAVGVKVHPSNCVHMPDHPDLMPVYQRCDELGLVIIADTNGRGGPDREDENGVPYGYPTTWVPVLSTFSKLKLIIAHFCDIMWDDRLDMAGRFGDNLYFDMSGGWADAHHPPSSHGVMPAEQVVRVFRKVGVERMLFGSDAPGGQMGILDAASQIVSLAFTDGEKRMMLSENAKRLVGLT